MIYSKYVATKSKILYGVYFMKDSRYSDVPNNTHTEGFGTDNHSLGSSPYLFHVCNLEISYDKRRISSSQVNGVFLKKLGRMHCDVLRALGPFISRSVAFIQNCERHHLS
jgi:hypothetical protein